MPRLILPLLAGFAICAPAPASDEARQVLEEVVVTAPFGYLLARDRVPARAQSATSTEMAALQPLDLSDLLNRGFGGVSINHAQNNPLQPDVNFRGFTASPLLGLPQGLSVYADGVRQNETFGDTVNWDLLAVSAIDSVQLLAGPNPVFGLNSLGGALSLKMKDGFNYQGSGVEAWGGSFARFGGTLQSGSNNGTWGHYGNVDYFEEGGWRDHSPSNAVRLLGSVSHRTETSTFDTSLGYASSDLTGNGPAPIELLEEDRSSVFTWPDNTRNELVQVIATGSLDLAGGWNLAGNAFFRHLDTDTFNGDGTIFEECSVGSGDYLCEEGDDEPILDQQGKPIESEFDGEELDAINNIGRRRQQNAGATLQLARGLELGGRRNDLMFGAAFTLGASRFDSVVEVAHLRDDRSTTRTGILAGEFLTDVDSEVSTWSVYVADTIDLTPRLSLTLAGRYDDTRVTLADRSGASPELNGKHDFGRFNPAAGLTLRAAPELQFYASASQASRTPSAVELACADEGAPCSLPNAFLADPPLNEVVARSLELGMHGAVVGGLEWHFDLFRTVNRDDILFQATGGLQGNVGYFSNAADTRRQGLELELSQRSERLFWRVEYALIDASYRDEFMVSSTNHPLADEGQLMVHVGARIPGIARHTVNLGLEIDATVKLRLGADLNWRSGVYLRGDEANLLDRTSSYAVVNLRADYHLSERLQLFARVENLFDTDYASFGLLGEPEDVLPDFDDPRFLGAGPPLGAWLGARITL